jgi:hypothetical protein
MTLSEQIISRALSGGWGAGEGFLARRRREREKKVEKRADLLARPDLLQTRVADVAQVLSLSTRALRTKKYGSKLEALEAQSRGTPQEGFASELLSEYTAALEDPKYIDVSERQLLAGVTGGLMNVPDREGKTRLEKAHRYKWEADTGLGNIFGLFGEDRSVRKLPGYEGWKAKEKVKPRDEWHTGPVEAAAVGAGWTAALIMGSKLIGRAIMPLSIPGAIIGGALIAIPEFMAIDAVRNVLHKTEWARAREGSWKAYVPAGIGLIGGVTAAKKAITFSIKKAAEKSVFSKGVTELLMKDPTAANAIRAGEAQKVAKAAQDRVDRVMLRYISREDALKSQFRTAEDYLGAVKGKTREEVAKLDIGAGERWAAYRVGRIGELRRGVAKIDVRTVLKEQRVGMVKGLEFAEVRAAEKAAKKARGSGELLLDAFQEASGRTKPISRKKVAKVFTKELSDKGTEAALKKAGKTGKLREAIVEQKRVQDLAKKQKKIPEKSKVAISRERAEARKKKKLQDKISEAAPIAAKAERLKLIKERAGILKKRKEGAKVITEAEPGVESIGKEFKDTISLEEAGLVETFKGGVEESMGGFADDTARDLVELFKDSGKLFGVGAVTAVGTTALLGAEEAEASTLVKMGLKAGRKLIKGRKVEVISEAEVPFGLRKRPGAIEDYDVWLRKFEKEQIKEAAKIKDITTVKFEKFGPLDGKKIEFIHHIIHKHDKTLKQAKDIADLFYERKIGSEGVRAMLAKDITPKPYALEGLKKTKEGRKLVETGTKPAKFIGIQERVKKPSYAMVNELDTMSTVPYDPAKHKLVNLPEYETAVGAVKAGGIGKLGLALFGSVPLASLFSPDSAEAAGLSKIGVQVPKVIAGLLKEAPGRREMLKLVKEMKDASLLHIPIAKGAKEVKYVQSTISTAKQAVEKNNNLIRNIKAETTPFGNWLTAKLSPYTTGNILYDINPIPEVGNLQSAIGNNVMNFLKATGNILGGVPGLIKKETAGIVEKGMAPLAKKYSKNVIAYRAVETEIEKLEKPLKKLYRALKKEGGAQHLPAIEKIEAKRASLLVAKKELGPIFNKFTKDWESKVKELAPKHPATRVALACEDTAEYVKYPWLKSLMKPEEEEAVIWLKNIFESYKGRMAAAGHDVIEGPFCHHALHPDWLEKGAKEVLEGFALDSKAIPFTKFFHRAKYSKMMMPDINYTMQKYILDAERRIQWSKFWGKGQKGSWYAHRRWIDTYGTEQQKMFWKRLSDAAVPPAPTKANVAANIYSSFEVLRLLGFSPSVALKHYFKNIGSASTMGAGNFSSHLPEAVTTAIKGAKNSPEMKSIYRLIGVKSSKGKRKVFDEVAGSFITQIHRMNMIADLDFEAIIPHKAGFWRAFTEKMQGINRWGSIPVRMIESVDRHHTILAAWEAGAKKGMTAQQAVYGIYNNILKLNFLSGACNPAWVRNPLIRAALLFQNTAFKIMERRLATAWLAGKDVKTAIGVIRYQNIQKTLTEMAEVGKLMLGAERQLKQNMIFDALTSSKDFFGTPVIKQAMTEAILSGAIIMGGGIAGMNLMAQVWHVPFLRHGAKAPTLAVNPFLNAIFRTAGEREEAEEYGIEKDFMIVAMTRNWLKSSGYLPQTANKLVRISKQDIPEIYAGSKWSYFFSVPAKEEY